MISLRDGIHHTDHLDTTNECVVSTDGACWLRIGRAHGEPYVMTGSHMCRLQSFAVRIWTSSRMHSTPSRAGNATETRSGLD